MNNIKSTFPVLNEVLSEMSLSFNGSLKQASEDVLSYKLPVYTFGKHIGDNFIALERRDNGYVFVFASYKGYKEVVRTESEPIYYDLADEEWTELIDKVMIEHGQKPKYLKFAAGEFYEKQNQVFSQQKGGCMLLFILLVVLPVGLILLLA